jgi:tol-pal system protein YbgF
MFMRFRNIALVSAAVFAGAIGGSVLGPGPSGAVSREIVDLQHDVTTLLQGQKDMSTQMTQDHTVLKTLVEQQGDAVGKLNVTMAGLQKSVQDVQANSGARLDTMSTQVQGLSDNLEEIKSRLGKLNQQLVDLQNTVQGIDAKISAGGTAAPSTTAPSTTSPTGGVASNQAPYNNPPTYSAPATNMPSTNAGPTPSADTLYSDGLRDITSGKYELAHQEFQDYLKYYGDTDLASNAQFYLGEIAYAQKNYQEAVDQYNLVLNKYPKSFKIASALYRKGMALIALGEKTSGVHELRDVIRRYPGTEEERKARAKLRDLGVPITASAANQQ